MGFPHEFALVTYLAGGLVCVFTFLCLCVKISVYVEDTCPLPFCSKRKRRKSRDKALNDMLFPPGEAVPPILAPPNQVPPSDENITQDIICQPYIYRDAHNTGLAQVSGKDLPQDLTLSAAPLDRNPSDAIVIK